MNRNERLIRSYIRESLLKEDLNDVSGVDKMAQEQPRVYGSGTDLYNTFVKPFVNVGKTAVGKAKEITRTARTGLEVGLKAALQTVIPGISFDFNKVFDKEKEDLEKIKSQYSDVYAATRETLSGGDAQMMAFLANPGLFLGAKLGAASPAIAKDLASIASGGLSDSVFDSIKDKAKGLGRWSLKDGSNKGSRRESIEFDEANFLIEILADENFKIDDKARFVYGNKLHLSEAEKQSDKNTKSVITPQKIIKSSAFMKSVDKGAAEMKKAAEAVIQRTAQNIVNAAKIKDLKDLPEKTQKEVNQFLKGDGSNLPKEQKDAFVKGIVDQAKKTAAKAAIEAIEKRLSSADAPKNSSFVQIYTAAKKQIEQNSK